MNDGTRKYLASGNEITDAIDNEADPYEKVAGATNSMMLKNFKRFTAGLFLMSGFHRLWSN